MAIFRRTVLNTRVLHDDVYLYSLHHFTSQILETLLIHKKNNNEFNLKLSTPFTNN